ncbi:MAG: hypothetical protein BWX79_01739 [Alphaproteobacteria bacterium ADurb.Bin100]|nr:MAG: hypothetical protein BWX79_01739 [Alphaproteobacteria bacterium ADurb.Bin100]
MLLRENRRTGGNPSDERQGQLGQAGQGQGELFHARFIDRPQGVAPEPDAARGATDQLDHAFAGQGLQVFFGGIGGLETEFGGDLGTGGGRTGACDGALDQVQNLLLAGGELGGKR